ncbi:MAG: hypothetical protein QM757_12065 [Paludibaculum sp.]
MLFLPALIVPSFAQTFSSDPAKGANPRHTVIAASGGTAPVGGNYNPLSFLNATVNPSGAVVFDAFLTGPPPSAAVFARKGHNTSPVALGVNPDPAGPSFGFVTNSFITRNGDVIFDSNFSDVFRSNGKTIVPLLKLGDPAPDGGTIASRGQERIVNKHGAISFVATISGAATSQAILRTDGSRTVTIASDNIAPPTGGRFTALLSMDMNDLGQVAFKSEITGGTADQGVFRGDGGLLTPIFVANQIAPGGGTFQDFGIPAINSHGQVVTICLLNNSTSAAGLFVGDGKDTIPIAILGQPAPKGGNYTVFTGSTRLNDHGDVVFQSRLSGAFSGMFHSNGKRTTTVALAGTNAPGTSGTFESFGDVFEFGTDGRIAFIARLAMGVGGVDSSNNTGLWTGTSEDDLHLVVRTGEVIGGNVLTDLHFAGAGAGGHPEAMNENSILWRGSFGPASALVLSQIPGSH